jgi:hypothetical protein
VSEAIRRADSMRQIASMLRLRSTDRPQASGCWDLICSASCSSFACCSGV